MEEQKELTLIEIDKSVINKKLKASQSRRSWNPDKKRMWQGRHKRLQNVQHSSELAIKA
jgi:hypothetical protein